MASTVKKEMTALKTQSEQNATSMVDELCEGSNQEDTPADARRSNKGGSNTSPSSAVTSSDSGLTSPSPQTQALSGAFLPGISPSPPDVRALGGACSPSLMGDVPPGLATHKLSPPDHLHAALGVGLDGDYQAWRNTTGAFNAKLFDTSPCGALGGKHQSNMFGSAPSPSPPFGTHDSSAFEGLNGTPQSQQQVPSLGQTPLHDAAPSLAVVKCPLCLEPYTHPKVLACFHSFCRDCLAKTVDTSEKVICPICQAETQLCADMGIDSLLHDYGLDNMLKQFNATQNNSTQQSSRQSPVSVSSSPGLQEQTMLDGPPLPTCTGCKSKESSAVAFCNDCTNFLCANCVMAHQFMHCFEGHRVQQLDDMDKRHVRRLAAAAEAKPVKCYQHRQQCLKYFCFTCNIPVCKECVTTEHPKTTHKFEPIADISDKQLEEMESLLGAARDKQRAMFGSFKCVDGTQQRLHMAISKVQGDIDETARYLQQLLEENRLRAHKELEQAYASKQMQLSVVDKKLQQTSDKLAHTIEFTGRLLKHASPAEVLVFKQLLETRMQVILNFEPDTAQLGAVCDLEFSSNSLTQGRTIMANTFGYVKSSLPGAAVGGECVKVGGVSVPPTPIGRPPSRHRLLQQQSYCAPSNNNLTANTLALNTGMAGLLSTSNSARSSGIGSQMSPQSLAIGHAFSDSNLLTANNNNQTTLGALQSVIGGQSQTGLLGNSLNAGNNNQPAPQHINAFDMSSHSLGPFSTFSEPHGIMPTQQHQQQQNAAGNAFQYEKWSSVADAGSGNSTLHTDLNAHTPYQYASPADSQLDVNGVSRLGAGLNLQATGLVGQQMSGSTYPPRSQIKRAKMIYHCKFGEFGVMEGQFTEPSGVAVNANQDIVVADTNNHRIQVFDKDGRFKFQFGECGKRDAQLLYPNRVAVNKVTGDIIVTERSPTHQIQVYNQYGQFQRKFGANILQHPRGVTVDCQGHIIVVECKVMRIIIFDASGQVLQKFSCSRHLEFPNGVCTNDKQEIFVSDNRAHSVKVFNYDGQFVRQIGGEGITNYPIGVGINHLGEVVVADNHNNFNVTIFQQDGTLINALESKVKHAQCFDVSLVDDGSVVLASKDYRLYLYRYMTVPNQTTNNNALMQQEQQHQHHNSNQLVSLNGLASPPIISSGQAPQFQAIGAFQ